MARVEREASFTLTLSEPEATTLYNLIYRGVGGTSPDRDMMSAIGEALEGVGVQYDHGVQVRGTVALTRP